MLLALVASSPRNAITWLLADMLDSASVRGSTIASGGRELFPPTRGFAEETMGPALIVAACWGLVPEGWLSVTATRIAPTATTPATAITAKNRMVRRRLAASAALVAGAAGPVGGSVDSGELIVCRC